jgi:hypothetical protein
MQDIVLPNGKTIKGIPDDYYMEDVEELAVLNNLATREEIRGWKLLGGAEKTQNEDTSSKEPLNNLPKPAKGDPSVDPRAAWTE